MSPKDSPEGTLRWPPEEVIRFFDAILEALARRGVGTAAIVLFDPMTGAYIGPKCAGDHPRPACIDPRCAIKSADHSAAVRRELERREAARKQREAERHDGPLVDTGPDDD